MEEQHAKIRLCKSTISVARSFSPGPLESLKGIWRIFLTKNCDKSIYKPVLTVMLVVVGFCISRAQQDTIEVSDIEVVKDYTPYLEQGKKQDFNPDLPESNVQPRTLNYSLPEEFVEVHSEPSEIRPLGLNYQNITDFRKIYFKGGFGNFNAPLAKVALAHEEAGDYAVGLNLGHYSLDGDLVADQKMSDTEGRFFARKYLPTSALGGEVTYRTNTDYQYGYDHSTLLLNEDDVKQRSTNILGKITLENTNDNISDIDYAFDLRVSNMADKLFDMKETNFGVNGELTKGFDIGMRAGIGLKTNFRNTTGLSNTEENDRLLTAIPFIEPVVGDWKIRLGASLNNDELHGFNIYPSVGYEKKLNDDRYTIFGGWKGQIQRFGLEDALNENPYLNAQSNLQNYTLEKRTPVGIKAQLSSNIAFNAYIAQELSTNQPLFVNEQDGSLIYTGNDRRFETVREDKLSNWLLHGDLNYFFSEKARVLINAQVNNYTTKSQDEPWHLPAFEFDAGIHVNPINKLFIKAGALARSGIKGRTDSGGVDKLKTLFDLSVGAQYQITDNIGVFIDGNNLANQNYMRWKNYESVGANVLGGFVLSY